MGKERKGKEEKERWKQRRNRESWGMLEEVKGGGKSRRNGRTNIRTEDHRADWKNKGKGKAGRMEGGERRVEE